MRSHSAYNIFIFASVLSAYLALVLWLGGISVFLIIYFLLTLAMIIALSLRDDLIITYSELIVVRKWKRYRIDWGMVKYVDCHHAGLPTYSFWLNDAAKARLPSLKYPL